MGKKKVVKRLMEDCTKGRICDSPKAQFFNDLGMVLTRNMEGMSYRDILEFLSYIKEWAKTTSKFRQFNGIGNSRYQRLLSGKQNTRSVASV